MACNQTKPKGRKRKLLPPDYTEFADPHSDKNQQSRDKLDFSGTSDIDKDSFGKTSHLNSQKNRTKLLDASDFHGDLLPLSQAGKFIPKFQTKIKTNQTPASENVRKKVSVLSNLFMENKFSANTESLECNFQQSLETHTMKDSKNSEDNLEPDNLLFNGESKQAADDTSHAFVAVEVAAPLKKKLNLMKNDEHDKLDTGASEQLSKKKAKGRVQRMPEKTLGIKKVKSTGVTQMNVANDLCSTSGMEGANITIVNSLESGFVYETLELERSADEDSQTKGFENAEESTTHDDNITKIEDLDLINSRSEAFDEKLIAADAVVEIERLELSQKESYGSKFSPVELHVALDDVTNECSMINSNLSQRSVKSASTGHQLNVNTVTAITESDSEVVNGSHHLPSNSRHMNSEADLHTEDTIKGSAKSQQVDKSCPNISWKTGGDQLSATLPSAYTTTHYQKVSDSDKLSQHNSTELEADNSSNCKAKETLQIETEPNCTESDILLDGEINHTQTIKLAEKCNTEAVENCGEHNFIAELGSSSYVGKSTGTEMTAQLQSQSGLLLQKSTDLGQEKYSNRQAVPLAHQELYSTFDDFPDVTDSQMYLLDEESVTKPMLTSSTNMSTLSTGRSCPGLANFSKAMDMIKSGDAVNINDAKRREGDKILQDLIKELTSVNAQLIRYRREIEKAKKERMEHLRSTSFARQY